MLEIVDLKKAYGEIRAVDGVSLRVRPGEIVGLLGPNGAGKTTTVSAIAGCLKPDSGEIRISGREIVKDTDAAKGMLGLVPQELALYEDLSALENLRYFGGLYGLSGTRFREASEGALHFVGLSDRARHKVKTFSGGMKRRLNLAAGLLHEPSILLLDEPTVGVDPQSRNAIFVNLEALKRMGKAILYTTHYMEEAERLCDRVIIVDHGSVLTEGPPRELSAGLPAACALRVDLTELPEEGLLHALASLPGVEGAESEGALLRVRLAHLSDAPSVVAWICARGIAFSHFESERPDLESVFLALTGRKLRDT